MLWNEEDDSYEDGFNFDEFAAQEVEESLARLEESFHKSQQHLPDLHQRRFQTAGVPRQPATVISSKRQRVEESRENKIQASTSRRPAPQPAVDDFRVSHQGQVQGGSKLPAGEGEFEDDGNMWGEMDLDRMESEAIQSSQRSQGRSAAAATTKGTTNGSRRIPSNEHLMKPSLLRGSKRYRDDENGIADLASNARRRASEQREAEVSADRKRIEELERQLALKDDELLRFKKENQTKIGEVSVLRANMNKTITEFSSVLKDKEEAIAKQKALNTEMKKMHEEQLARSETINAFKHTELATAAHWSSITASVARRRGLPSSQRGYSQSQSQTVAAAVGLTTPTRRNRGSSTRNLGSGEGATQRSGGDRDRRSRANGEESPSRKSALKQHRQNLLESATKAKAKTPAFPGFVNLFAKPSIPTPRPASKSGRDNKAEPTKEAEVADDDGAVFQDDIPAQNTEVEVTHVEQACGPSSSLVVDQEDHPQVEPKIPTGWDHPQYRYLWAVTTYSKQLSFISSLILSHSSAPCSTSSTSSHAISHSSTLYRLLNASFPAQTPIALQEQYIVTTHMLLNILSQGTATDAEDRFAYLLDKFDYEEHMDLDDEDKLKEEIKEFWACHTVINEGVNDVLNGIASILCTMMAISLQSGMIQRLHDVFILMRSICIHQPSMISAILTGFSTSQLLADVERSQVVGQTPSQDASPPVQLEMDVIKVIITCIRRATVKMERREKEEEDGWRLQEEESKQLLKALLGMIEVIANEVQSSNHYSSLCAHNLKRIIDEPGILASLLNHNARSALTIRQTISILITLSQHNSLWRNIAACKIDKNLEPQRKVNSFISKSETPLLEILARQLVDGRLKMGAMEAHAIHCDIVCLLSQLIILHSDALVLVSESNSILAAIVKSLQIDTGLVWNDEGEEIRSHKDVRVIDIVQRIYLDVRLLSRLYICPQRSANLAKKLQSHESHLLLNGIKHCFILAISRVAFAPEPDWVDAISSHQLSTVNEVAADLLELVLSPEEMESAWEMLNDEEEEEDKTPLPPPSPPQAEEEEEMVESQTQMDEDDQDVIVIS